MILVTDFDNTLYSKHNPNVLTDNLQAARTFRQAGNQFILATGRSISSLSRVLPDPYRHFDYLILENGAVCLDQTSKTLFRCNIPERLCMNISRDILQNFGQTAVAFIYYHDNSEWPKPSSHTTRIRCWTTTPLIGHQILDYLRKTYSDQLQIFLSRDAVLANYSWIANPEQFHSFIDITAKNSGKENAIQRLMSPPPQRIITAGDDTNDIGMLTQFEGYAMKNSTPEVLSLLPKDRIITSIHSLIETRLN